MWSKLRALADYVRVFPSIRDARTFRHLGKKGRGDATAAVRVRQMPMELPLRLGTSDASVFWDAFVNRYHLPSHPLPSGPTIFDLGANVGYTAAHFASAYPGSRVIAVEMDADNAACARKLLEPIDNAELVHAALWYEDGEVTYDGAAREWAFHVAEEPISVKQAVTVQAVTMNALLDRYGIRHIDYVKMDIEGAEGGVLAVANEWLDVVSALTVELHPRKNPRATFDECAAILERRGFRCLPHRRHPDALVAQRKT